MMEFLVILFVLSLIILAIGFSFRNECKCGHEKHIDWKCKGKIDYNGSPYKNLNCLCHGKIKVGK